ADNDNDRGAGRAGLSGECKLSGIGASNNFRECLFRNTDYSPGEVFGWENCRRSFWQLTEPLCASDADGLCEPVAKSAFLESSCNARHALFAGGIIRNSDVLVRRIQLYQYAQNTDTRHLPDHRP